MPSVYYEINKKSTFCISRMSTTILDVIILPYIFINYNILFCIKNKKSFLLKVSRTMSMLATYSFQAVTCFNY